MTQETRITLFLLAGLVAALRANDGYSCEWVPFRKAQLRPHDWGMGNLFYRVACRSTC